MYIPPLVLRCSVSERCGPMVWGTAAVSCASVVLGGMKPSSPGTCTRIDDSIKSKHIFIMY